MTLLNSWDRLPTASERSWIFAMVVLQVARTQYGISCFRLEGAVKVCRQTSPNAHWWGSGHPFWPQGGLDRIVEGRKNFPRQDSEAASDVMV